MAAISQSGRRAASFIWMMPMGVEHKTIVDTIYAAIGDEDAYAAAIGMIAHYAGATSGWFMAQHHGVLGVERSHNIDLSFLPQYEAYYCNHDLWWCARDRIPLHRAISFERVVPTREFERCEFYGEVVRHHGDALHAIGIATAIGGNLFTATLHRTSTGEPFDVAVEARLQTLVPHLERMALTRQRIEPARRRARLSDEAFQQLDDAVYLCDRRGRVLHRNLMGRDGVAGVLALAADGQLRCLDRDDERRFAGALHEAATRRTSAVLLVERRDGLPVRIAIDPVFPGEVAFVVIVRDYERLLHTKLDQAQARYGFTPSERALAESLVRGRTVEQHARLRGIGVSTVRSQLKSLLAKSGTARQAELVATIQRF